MKIVSVSEFVDVMPMPVEASYQDMSAQIGITAPPSARLRVIGVGGGGSNAVNRMIESGLTGIEFAAVNTDVQDLYKSKASLKIQIGIKLTGGRGAGGKPEQGESAAKEDLDVLRELVMGVDMIFLTCGMGGGTGTGAAPIIARLAREQGVLVVGVVTRPFDFEGEKKSQIAEEGIRKMREAVDTLVVIPNQRIYKIADRRTTAPQAYRMADDVLRQGVQGITDLILCTGLINTDFADVEATMRGQGDALMGIGIKDGDARAKEAAEEAIDNPLLEDTSIEGATRLLVNIAGSEEISIIEVSEIMDVIRAKADKDVETIHGLTIDPTLGDKIKVTVIATGFKSKPAAQAPKVEQFKKSESARGKVLSPELFDAMRGLGENKRPNEGYVGYRGSKSFVAGE
ncbi:MAG: cell division protein FtsZ, partial [Treponema sp.]|nr:cell division protein FtsZ [Treponema sp.]